MKEYTTTATINADPKTVWSVLTDSARYSEWNPEIVGIDGQMHTGARVKVQVRLGTGAVRNLAQRILTFDPPTKLVWQGGLPLGLFVGRRTFTLIPVPDGTEFRMHIRMSGPLSAPIIKSMGDRQPEIDKFSAALKVRAESL